MKLLIKALRDAISYIPDNRTYAIRIFSSFVKERDKLPLHSSGLWVNVAEYVFDDNTDSYMACPKTIDDKIAISIITDFARHRETTETLLVHCTLGRNRSPAVAMALNDIFKLGYIPKELREEYVVANLYVYPKLLEIAPVLKLK